MNPIHRFNKEARVRLAEAEKPTIVKSLKNGKFYCGIGLTQSLYYAAANWRHPNQASLRDPLYSTGYTAKGAYDAWVARRAYLQRFRPKVRQ